MELSGKTVGIVGLGEIGSRVAERLRVFGVELLAYDPYITDERVHQFGCSRVGWKDLLARSNIVMIHCPLTDETRAMFRRESFEMCRAGLVLINMARGGIVAEADALEALDRDVLYAYGTDVFEKEPPERNNALFSHPKVVVTSHLGAQTVEAQEKVGLSIARQILEWIETGVVSRPLNEIYRPKTMPE